MPPASLPSGVRHQARRGLVLLLVALPWLNPFAPGPSTGLAPWMTGAACAIVLWALAAGHGARLSWPAALACLLPLASATLTPQRLPELLLFSSALMLVVLTAAATRALPTGWQLGLLTAATLSAIMGLAQAFGLATALWPWISHAQIGDAYGNLRQPNQFGTLCWLGVAVLLWGRPRLHTLLAWALAALLGLAAAASASRTAVAHGLLLGLLVLAWSGDNRWRALRTWAVAAVSFAVAALTLPALILRVTGVAPARGLVNRLAEGPPSCSARSTLWDNMLTLIAQRPWSGWGWGELDFAHFWTLYPGERFCDILDNAHNLPLHLAVELGLPIAGTLLLLGTVWALRRRPWAAAAGQQRLAWAMLALIGLHSMLEYPLWYAPFQMAAGCAIGALTPVRTASAHPHRPSLLLAGILAAALAWAAWDYGRVSQAYRAPDERWPSMRQDPAGQMAGHWLYGQQARFAQLWSATPTPETAPALQAQAMALLHYSPEPRLIELAIAAARMSGRTADAQALELRYRRAFPERWAGWRAADKPISAE